MTIDDQTLAKLEKLSSLKIEESKKEGVKHSIEEILNFAQNLNTLDLSQVSATFSTLSGGTPLRADEPSKSDVASSVLAHAPKSENNYFIVPKIIE